MTYHAPLVMVHLSDIHFGVLRHGSAYDLDGPIRLALEQDAEALRHHLGSPQAVLVTGDIAFRGADAEYERAYQWIVEQLCRRTLDCPPEAVQCVPGNHDIQRSVLKKTYRDAHQRLRSCELSDIDAEMQGYLDEPHVFYDAIKNYNAFAARFGCDLSVDSPTSTISYNLDEHLQIFIHGLNSALVSDDEDSDLRDDRKLVLGAHQYLYRRSPGQEHIILCHHPPVWLRDGQAALQTWSQHAALVLVGHRHQQAFHQHGRLAMIDAGAVHPNRRENGWCPSYNWIVLDVVDVDGERTLRIHIYPRKWSTHRQHFVADADLTGDNDPFLIHTVALEPAAKLDANSITCRSSINTSPVAPGPLPVTEITESARAVDVVRVDNSTILDPIRTVTRRFLELAYPKRVAIAQRLGLITEGDEYLSQHAMMKEWLNRCGTAELLPQFWEAVQDLHADGKYPTNPFTA